MLSEILQLVFLIHALSLPCTHLLSCLSTSRQTISWYQIDSMIPFEFKLLTPSLSFSKPSKATVFFFFSWLLLLSSLRCCSRLRRSSCTRPSPLESCWTVFSLFTVSKHRFPWLILFFIFINRFLSEPCSVKSFIANLLRFGSLSSKSRSGFVFFRSRGWFRLTKARSC